MFASQQCITDLIVNLYRALRPLENANENTPVYMKPIIKYMRGYKESEINAALKELEQNDTIIIKIDEENKDTVVLDFTPQGYKEYRDLFAGIDEYDFNL